jgi:hypothetical protein
MTHANTCCVGGGTCTDFCFFFFGATDFDFLEEVEVTDRLSLDVVEWVEECFLRCLDSSGDVLVLALVLVLVLAFAAEMDG